MSGILDHAEFVATKFASNHEGWVYSRDLGDLKHIRYGHDSTGYNHWTKRLKRAFNPKDLLALDSFSRTFKVKPSFIGAWAHIVCTLRKDTHLPDGQINRIITHWEEDGEYIAYFQPRVGMKVIEFLRSRPDDPWAKIILAEMQACAELSWPSKKEDA